MADGRGIGEYGWRVRMAYAYRMAGAESRPRAIEVLVGAMIGAALSLVAGVGVNWQSAGITVAAAVLAIPVIRGYDIARYLARSREVLRDDDIRILRDDLATLATKVSAAPMPAKPTPPLKKSPPEDYIGVRWRDDGWASPVAICPEDGIALQFQNTSHPHTDPRAPQSGDLVMGEKGGRSVSATEWGYLWCPKGHRYNFTTTMNFGSAVALVQSIMKRNIEEQETPPV